ncbi:lysine-2,3-aminomutase-like protein [Chelatococcus reniformis]|uniref:Lysine 2,3-aminomutase n=1 Tax=Chelatococcus reniformis TaxID=1494448 RepID=A0A916X9B5_9HYPH|nr:lysine-2,3-aminomutase-like protein [Chelatococcus reniformis]GGC54251.1 lysine 2,3-aminomutase [Chelatococcus reniformis]
MTSPADLTAAGLVTPGRDAALAAVAARYAVAVTPAVADLIDPTDVADPIARQFLPDAAELVTTPQERADPIGDDAMSPRKGLVHRYPDRVLLKLVAVCPVYCRFCFRRETVGPGGAGMLSEAELDGAVAYIAADPQIWEVVVSGGDPLITSPRRLAAVMARLRDIDHVKVVRFHTRVPVVAPDRVGPELIAALKATGKTTYVVLHTNHAREFSPAGRSALAALADAGIPLLAQTVLLKGVNDEPAALEALLRTCVENRVKPYYLHHADLAPGTSHLRTSIGTGQALMRTLRGRLSGIAQPVYVLDIPGGHGKVPIGPAYLCDAPEAVDDPVEVIDPAGRRHRYPPV